jgi:hypothetical protein
MKSELKKKIKEILKGKDDLPHILLAAERPPDRYRLLHEDRIITKEEFEILKKDYHRAIVFCDFNNRNI